MKLITPFLSITLSLSHIVLPVVYAQTETFPDMENSWYLYQEAAEELRERGVMEGDPTGNFRPRDPINRAEFLKIVFKGRSSNDPVSGDCFPDVPQDAWYAPYICAAARRDIVKGYPDGTFKPDQPVNFAEAMKMLLLAYDGPVGTTRKGQEWYEPYTQEFDKPGILRRSSYIPWEPLNRERAADMLLRFLNYQEDRTIPNLSPGCGKAKSDADTTISVDGVDRSYLLTTPSRYVIHDPWPLIVAFHGRTNSNEQVRKYFGLDKETDEYFIAYPAAIAKDNGTFTWSDPGDKLSTLRDVAFFDAIVKELGDTYCIDLNRIYTVGHSLGAWMANSVACARGGVVRASATVGGSSMIAPCTGPSAAMIMNNPADTLSPASGAKATRDLRIQSNKCSTESAPIAPQSLLCQKYSECDGGNDVYWCPHEIDSGRNGTNYPHIWPDGTAKAMVEFFENLE